MEAARSRVSVATEEDGQEGDENEDSEDRLFLLDKTGVVADVVGAAGVVGGSDSDSANAAIELMVPLPP